MKMTDKTVDAVANQKQMVLTMKKSDGVNIFIAGTGEVKLIWDMGKMEIRKTHNLLPFDETRWNKKWNYRYSNLDWKTTYYYEMGIYGYGNSINPSTHTITIIGENVTHLCCDEIDLTMLDVSKNSALKHLECRDNQLTNLNVANNNELTYLDCRSNQIKNFEVSNNLKLTNLYCDEVQFTKEDHIEDEYFDVLIRKEKIIIQQGETIAQQGEELAQKDEALVKSAETIADQAAKIAELERKLAFIKTTN